MKKVLSVFFAIVLVFSAFSLNAFALETTKTAEWASNHEFSNEMAAELSVSIDNRKWSFLSSTIYMKEEKFACDFTYNNLELRAISDGNSVWIFSPKFPLLHIKTKLDKSFTEDTSLSKEKLEFLKGYEIKEDSTTYYVEEFSVDESNVIRFYFNGDELERVEIPQMVDDISVLLQMKLISLDVNDEVFETPRFSLNIYPLAKLFFDFSI